ncbi:MAG: hypothetical protein Q8K72_20250, partial [Acidimicrobiales bacterium]|nr:hypothetical protein [Acidimicrobiales bacterium]
ANWLAWTAGLAAWTLGLATSRGVLANADVSRYQLIAVGFILLSVVPRSRPAWATRLEQPTRAPALAVLCALVLLAGAARIPSLARDSSFAQVMDNSAPLDRGRLVVVDVGPEALPDDTELPVTMGFLSAGEVRGLLDRYGHPFSSTEPDAELVEVGAVEVSVAPGRRPTDCSPIDAPLFVESATAVDPLVLWSPDGPVDVALRRFGDAWVPLTTTTPGSVVRLRLPKLESQVPWQIRAFGACR